MSYPRRSARLSPHANSNHNQNQQQQHHHHQQQQQQNLSGSFPPFAQYSQPSSASTTSHPSPVNDSTNPPPPPPTPYTPQPNLQAAFMGMMPQKSHLNAPLPSPSAGDLEPIFGGRPHSQANPHAQSSQGSQQFQQQQPQYQSQGYGQQTQHLHPHHNSLSHSHPPNIPGHLAGAGQQPPPDFLAEAAKRAQMACLMRDLGDVSI